MKPSAAWFAGSLVVNVALLGVLVAKPAWLPAGWRDSLGLSPSSPSAVVVRNAVEPAAAAKKAIAVSLPKYWTSLHSVDLPTFVAHLRAAGFPPSLVRALVEAELTARMSARMKALVGTYADVPFWKPQRQGAWDDPRFSEEVSQLYRDRAQQLRSLLGDDFFSDANESRTRQFGSIPTEKLELLQRIADDYAELSAQVKTSAQGIILPEDREKLALLEREKRTDLDALLTPQEAEEYLMRTSNVTRRLNSAFTLMDASEEEFRSIFRIEQPFADLLYPTTPGAVSYQDRRDAQLKMDEQLKTTLGDARFAEFTRDTSGEFQNLYRIAQRENVPLQAAVSAYSLRDSTAAESDRIFSDPHQSAEEKRTAMQALAQSTRTSLMSQLGPTAGEAYIRSAGWLKAIEGGMAVSFIGNSTNMRSLPPAGTPAARKN